MNTVVDQKLSSLSVSEIIPFECVTFVAGKKPKLKNTRFCWDRIAMVAPKISLNTSNATLWTQNDWKCHSQCWHVLFRRSWLDKFCIFFKYLLTELCDSLLSWPCVNLGRLSHQKTFITNTFCLYNNVVDSYFRDFTLPLVPSARSADDCMLSLIKTYEHQENFVVFLLKKSINK